MVFWINILLLVLAIPVGYIIAGMARDEIVGFKKYFRVLIIIGIILSMWFWLIKEVVISLTVVFFLIIVIISLVFSGDKKFVMQKI